jgi:CRISPR-associated RAMP protein (TIGR02581 family)
MTRRVEFTGRLRMTSALHVGGGIGTTSFTDAGVLRHPNGEPFIPGSSMKGVLRSHVERLAQTPAMAAAGVTSCLLYPDDPDATTAPDCPSPGWIDAGKDATAADESDFEALCHTCTLFGSPILAGKVQIPDLEVIPETYAGEVEIRDGVGIDRDRGRPVEGIKFDYEVVPSGTAFRFSFSLDSPSDAELALAAVAVREMQRGHVSVGAKTTRGLGSCALEEVEVRSANFTNIDDLGDYLLARTSEEGAPAPEDDPDAFIDRCIEELFSPTG